MFILAMILLDATTDLPAWAFEKGGPYILIVGAFVAGFRRLWMWRYQHEDIIALKDREINRLEEERKRERERGDRWEAMSLRLLETGREAMAVTAAAVVKKTEQLHD